MSANYLTRRSDESFTVYIDVVTRSVSAGVFLTCALSFIFWKMIGLVIINPFISVVAAGASVLFFAMGTVIRNQRLEGYRGETSAL
jgi:hypothetical protein